jgi:hypothetical protein
MISRRRRAKPLAYFAAAPTRRKRLPEGTERIAIGNAFDWAYTGRRGKLDDGSSPWLSHAWTLRHDRAHGSV